VVADGYERPAKIAMERTVMEMRALGSTGLMASRMGLGMAALGRPGYINLEHATDLARNYDEAAMQGRTFEVLDAAWDAGVCYFDVARSYGLGEKFLGNWLSHRAVSPKSVTVGSKWGYTYTADWQIEAQAHEIKEHSLATFERQWRETMEFLSGYLNLYQIHSATAESGVLENREVLRELARLKSEGLKIGLTSSGPRQGETLRKAIELEIDGVRLFDVVQATWNLLEPSAGPALSEVHAAGVGVIVKEALANGRLTIRNKEPGFALKLTQLEAEAGKLQTSIDALALAAGLSQPFADVVLSGATTVAQIISNLQACHLNIDRATVARWSELPEPPELYWSTRSKLPWN
jgi:aryl-alcohol dehydrogenase-like predicted oxidoreductase